MCIRDRPGTIDVEVKLEPIKIKKEAKVVEVQSAAPVKENRENEDLRLKVAELEETIAQLKSSPREVVYVERERPIWQRPSSPRRVTV